MSVSRTAALLGAATLLAAGVSGCSGSHRAPAAAARPAASSTGWCDREAFADHAGAAAGALRGYVWKPFMQGAFRPAAPSRAAQLRTAGRAGSFASAQLTQAQAQVRGCAQSTRLVNALSAGIALSRSVSRQLSHDAVNTEALGGANSIVTTVLAEARQIGLDAPVHTPSPAQLVTRP